MLLPTNGTGCCLHALHSFKLLSPYEGPLHEVAFFVPAFASPAISSSIFPRRCIAGEETVFAPYGRIVSVVYLPYTVVALAHFESYRVLVCTAGVCLGSLPMLLSGT